MLQSETWHCRKNAWHSSFIMLIGEINSHLCFPWLPLRHISGLRRVANLPVYHFAFCANTMRLLWYLNFFLEHTKKGHYERLSVSKPVLQYLSDLSEGSVALWKNLPPPTGGKKIGFSEFYPSLGSMQCPNYLLHLSIKVSLSVYCSH